MHFRRRGCISIGGGGLLQLKEGAQLGRSRRGSISVGAGGGAFEQECEGVYFSLKRGASE